MSTILYPDIIFGPIHSRRLGISLGINLLPITKKLCTFDCLYCECGLGDMEGLKKLPETASIKKALIQRIEQLKAASVIPDVLTFAGNGEPTLHPQFPQIIDAVREIRDTLLPQTKISVLSNATQIHRAEIRAALLQVDNNILKLDSGIEATAKILNRPWDKNYSIAQTVGNMKRFRGQLIVQTMFIRGNYQGVFFDNTNEKEVAAWISSIKEIAPKSVMIYAIDRETPVHSLQKISVGELNGIAARLLDETGIKASVAG